MNVTLVRRSLRPLCYAFVLSLIAALGIGIQAPTFAAPPEAKGKKATAETKDGKEPIVEKPSLPYLTLLLVRDASIHTELSLSPTQIGKVEAAIASVDPLLWQLRDVPVDRSGAQASAMLSQLRDQLKKDLKKSQLDRLDQLILQARGIKALFAPEVGQRLKLTTSQLTQLKKVLDDTTADSSKKEGSVETSQTQQQRNEAAQKRVNAVLNSKQSATLQTMLGKPFDFSQVVQIGCIAPEIRGVEAWINSEPLTLQEQRGKVVVLHYWAFGCINCIRNLPHYQSWYEKFSKDDVTIIGFQTPETDAERNLDNLRRNVRERQIEYPVAFDLKSENWKAWGNDMWPSVYLIDKRGRVRNWWYGELNWQGGNGEEFMRKKIEQLVAEPE